MKYLGYLRWYKPGQDLFLRAVPASSAEQSTDMQPDSY